eukprot:6381558-Prymnesium_polylepis.2
MKQPTQTRSEGWPTESMLTDILTVPTPFLHVICRAHRTLCMCVIPCWAVGRMHVGFGAMCAGLAMRTRLELTKLV